MEIRPREYAVAKSIQMGYKHEEMIIHNPSTGKPYMHINTNPQSQYNMSLVDDPYINERLAAIWAWENMADQDKRAQLVRELTVDSTRSWPSCI